MGAAGSEKYTTDAIELVLTIDDHATVTGLDANSKGSIFVQSNGWGNKLSKDFIGATATSDTFSLTAGDADATITIGTLGEPSATKIATAWPDASGTYKAANAGDLKLTWALNQTKSTIGGVEGGAANASFGTFSGITNTNIHWNGNGSWVDGDIMVFDATFTYDGISVKIDEALEIDVEA
jgi:hypothetical protein